MEKYVMLDISMAADKNIVGAVEFIFNNSISITNGVALIAKERQEQIEKHGYTKESDKGLYLKGDLKKLAQYFLSDDEEEKMKLKNYFLREHGYIEKFFDNVEINKSYKDRLIIAGALIAAEIDMVC